MLGLRLVCKYGKLYVGESRCLIFHACLYALVVRVISMSLCSCVCMCGVSMIKYCSRKHYTLRQYLVAFPFSFSHLDLYIISLNSYVFVNIYYRGIINYFIWFKMAFRGSNLAYSVHILSLTTFWRTPKFLLLRKWRLN